MRLKDFLQSSPKVIARTRSGELFKGYLVGGRRLLHGEARLRPAEGGPALPVEIDKLKGLFFVRDFEGDRSYLENKTLGADPERPGLRVRLRFEDNETIEGIVENSLDLLAGPGFFFWPGDPNSNNQLIYVVKSALLGFTVLGVKG